MEEARILMGTSEIEEIQDSIDISFSTFKNFAVSYSCPSDHHFINSPQILQQRRFLCGSRKSKNQVIQLRKRMEQEWEILKDNLPNSMYVRAYVGKIQLMRAVIIGLKDTPYAYGLFFFDIFFPRDYPSKPPLIFQRCNNKLLVLKTTTLSYNKDGRKWLKVGPRFMWDPHTSNVFNVLELIQGYVLKTSTIYSKDVEEDFLVSSIAMLCILRSPPMEFDDFVKGYFRKFSHVILMKFRIEGNLGESEVRTELFFELLKAFETNGSNCKHHVSEVERKTSLSKHKFSRINLSVNDSSVTCFKKFMC